MNRIDRPNLPIDLAHVPDFALGGIHVRPSSREVEGPGFREVLEPRVMQVLVALAQAGGAVVSRDDLVQRCWEGRIVGEDAINRCVAKIRRVSEADGGASFTVDTVPRVGYRLAVVDIEPAGPAPIPLTPAAPPLSPPKASPARMRIVAITLSVAAIVVSGIGLFPWWAAQPRWVLQSSGYIVSTPLIERHPAISPDATMLAYSAGSDILTRKIYVKRISGGDPIKLTDDTYDDVAPNWSHDGSRIVYVAAKPGEPCHIMIVPVPAGLPREVGRCQTDERSRADWDASGEALYFTDRPNKEEPDRVVRLDIATGKKSDITRPMPGTEGDQELSISPNGRYLGFMRYETEVVMQFVLHDLRTGAERSFLKGEDLIGVAWSDDADALFIAENRGSDVAIRRFPLGGGAPTDITFSPLEIGRMNYGAGGLLATEVDSVRLNVARPPAAPGGAPLIVDAANKETWGLSLAPDGTLAMVSNRSGKYGIWLMPAGKPAGELVSFGRDGAGGLSWSPEGSRIAAVSSVGGSLAIRVLTKGGAQVATIPISATEIVDPDWTSDGKALLFSARDAKGFRLWRVDLSDPAKRVPISDYGWSAVKVHGSDLFAVKSDKGGIWQLGAAPRLITPKLPPERRYQWRIVGDDIVFADFSNRDHPQLRAQPISGGPDQPFADTPLLWDQSEFVVDPRTGGVMYVAFIKDDSDIQLLRLARR